MFKIILNNDDIVSLDISTLFRILERVRKENDEELKTSNTKDFLMKILGHHGQSPSALFEFSYISAFDDKTLTHLLTEYSENFEFGFITRPVLKVYLTMKKEQQKYDDSVRELQEKKNIKKKINKQLKQIKSENDELRSKQEYDEKERQVFFLFC